MHIKIPKSDCCVTRTTGQSTTVWAELNRYHGFCVTRQWTKNGWQLTKINSVKTVLHIVHKPSTAGDGSNFEHGLLLINYVNYEFGADGFAVQTLIQISGYLFFIDEKRVRNRFVLQNMFIYKAVKNDTRVKCNESIGFKLTDTNLFENRVTNHLQMIDGNVPRQIHHVADGLARFRLKTGQHRAHGFRHFERKTAYMRRAKN